MQGAQPRTVDLEAAFYYWYNDGQRRTFGQVADEYGVHYNTARGWASDGDWDRRAGDLDAEVQAQTDKALALTIVRQRQRNVQMAAAVLAKFARRLPDEVRDETGNMVPNPHRLAAGDITIRDAEVLMRYVELMAGSPTHRLAISGPGDEPDGTAATLAAIEQEIAELELHELAAVSVTDEDGRHVDAAIVESVRKETMDTDNAGTPPAGGEQA